MLGLFQVFFCFNGSLKVLQFLGWVFIGCICVDGGEGLGWTMAVHLVVRRPVVKLAMLVA